MLGEAEGEQVVIPILLRIDPETGLGEYDLVDEFNKEYEGRYRVDVSWITENEQGYRDELKLLNALDQLPAVITDAAFSSEFYSLMTKNGRFVNLYPYIRDRQEWQNLSGSDEEIYLAPLEEGFYSSAGIFYNKKIFEAAGIKNFPETWEDFFDCLERLKNYGVVPLTSHESGEYWCAMLLSTAYMCSDDTGLSFIRETLPDSYHNESVAKMLECMYRIHQYTFDDADQLNFNQAEERFFHGEAAMMANGYWMIQEIDPNIIDDIGFAPFPGNSMMVDASMSGWAVVSGYDEKVVEGAVEFLTYRQRRSQIEEEKLSKLEKEFYQVFQKKQRSFPNYQIHWSEPILHEFFNKEFPLYLKGEIDVETFLSDIDKEME